ncbi:adenosylcobinamide-GDP ribazoletransferase [Allorhizobium sp. BGMRC 0089]|uniref:adenosylcobinamide-GDP ribazoletransferase n=1 Tax=Allorhizobium sonneratiae TaxID=2934936 RepID=UPI0020338316|nr:adenosylcobinamide-GDP ribazoletransferase [Allorhizobium sonneratiae]
MLDLGAFIQDLARSIGFLSRLPVSARFFDGHSGEMSRTPRAFPLAGAVIAAPAGLVLALSVGLGASATLSAFLAVASQVLLTGALHEDGLADTADGFGSHDREKALTIMKDSHIGTYGVLALILSIGIRVSALAALINALPPMQVALIMIGVAAGSRAMMVWHWRSLPPARPGGLAASLGQPEEGTMYAALFLGLLIFTLAIAPFAMLHAPAAALIFSTAAIFGFNRLILKRLGGQTGDTIGACQQICEIVALASLSMTL